jgi:CheY-like chemotaxis protein
MLPAGVSETRIVVADDDPDILKLIERRLGMRGYDVTTALNGARALEAVAAQTPDAVVLDWLMPTMSGVEACAELKGNPETSEIPVVLLTAKAADTDIDEGARAGADGYLTKPFELYDLDTLLRRLIRERSSDSVE